MVTSNAYRLTSSTVSAGDSLARDPENRTWWRRVPVRLESQVVRDSLLAQAEVLEGTIGGPPVLAAKQADSRRRSLYFFHSNNDRNPFLMTFDEAMVTECYRRDQSIVPQQALALINSRLVLDAAPRIADLLTHRHGDEQEFVRAAFLLLLGIDATRAELAAAQEALSAWHRGDEKQTPVARTRFIWTLLNHNDFVTLR